MERAGLSSECKNLELIINNLVTGKETCRIEDSGHSLDEVIEYLCDYLKELEELDNQISKYGNTKEMLDKVREKYNELWLFQLSFYIDSLPSVIGGLWSYPETEE